jgi:hypothetical protein
MNEPVPVVPLVALWLCGCHAAQPPLDASVEVADTASVADAEDVSGVVQVRGPLDLTLSRGMAVWARTGIEPVPQPRPVYLWTFFRPGQDACAEHRGGPVTPPNQLAVTLRGPDVDGLEFLPPVEGDYPVQAGIAGGEALTAQLYFNVDDGNGPPTPIPGESGSVRLEGITDEGGPRMVIDAVLQDGTTVRGSMQLAWCELRFGP